VARTAQAQGVQVIFDDSLIDMLAAEGFRPEYGARELKRQIRSLVETRLARAMLGGEVTQGDRVRIGWDQQAEQVRIEPVTQDEAGAEAPEDRSAAE
ncbi:Clp protease ClpC, partial [Rubellimicrobium sp. CFH 75288]|nr:Clp protease ClpC [Rubellimicrobium sp. CFH 75288]